MSPDRKKVPVVDRRPVGDLSSLLAARAAAARRVFGASEREELLAYLRSRLNADGGFAGRSPVSDLYYTVFGLEGVVALGGSLPPRKVQSYVDAFGDGQDLDFVHLTCLARCRARLPRLVTHMDAEQAILRRLEGFRSEDGGYHAVPHNPLASAYSCFLAFLAYEGFEVPVPRPHDLVRSLHMLRREDGSFSNEPEAESGNAPATAAAMLLGKHLGEPVSPVAMDWLLARCGPQGGFHATPQARLPDLLSTATALLALVAVGADLDGVRERCLDFVEALWADDAGFRGHAADPASDCEYTFYGLLALGCLGT